MKVLLADFERNVDRFQDAAQGAPVEIVKDGQARAVLVSASFYQLITQGRVARVIEDVDDETMAAIAGSALSSEFDALDDIVKDWTP